MVEEENQDGNVNLYLTVHPDDMGIVIGKGGQTIHALRKILTVRAIAENVRVNLQLNEPEGGGQPEKETPAEEIVEPEVENKEDAPEEKPEEGEPEEK